jgi:hypothetical protein
MLVAAAATLLLSASGLGISAPGGGVYGIGAAGADAVFVPGTGNPGETGSTHQGNEQVVAYKAAQPVTDDYTGSVHDGVNGLNVRVGSLPVGVSAEVGGYSQGAQVVRVWAAQPGATDNREVTITTTGDPCTEGTGILVRYPQLQAVMGVPCSPFPPGVHAVVINSADDPLADAPTDLSVVSVANAIAGYYYYHGGGYGPDQLNRADVRSYQVGNTVYVTIPAGQTAPLVMAARDHDIPVSPEVEAWVNSVVAHSDPGPAGAPPPAMAPAVQTAALPMTPVSAPAPMAAADPVETVQEAAAPYVEPVVDQATTWVDSTADSAGQGIAQAAAAATVVAPAQADVISQVADQAQAAVAGAAQQAQGFLNSLLPPR